VPTVSDQGTIACDWSELIHYLLNATFAMPLRTRDIAFPDPRGISLNLNRTAFAAKEGWFDPAFVPPEVSKLSKDGQPPSEERIGPEFEDGGQGRVIIIETSEAQG